MDGSSATAEYIILGLSSAIFVLNTVIVVANILVGKYDRFVNIFSSFLILLAILGATGASVLLTLFQKKVEGFDMKSVTESMDFIVAILLIAFQHFSATIVEVTVIFRMIRRSKRSNAMAVKSGTGRSKRTDTIAGKFGTFVQFLSIVSSIVIVAFFGARRKNPFDIELSNPSSLVVAASALSFIFLCCHPATVGRSFLLYGLMMGAYIIVGEVTNKDSSTAKKVTSAIQVLDAIGTQTLFYIELWKYSRRFKGVEIGFRSDSGIQRKKAKSSRPRLDEPHQLFPQPREPPTDDTPDNRIQSEAEGVEDDYVSLDGEGNHDFIDTFFDNVFSSPDVGWNFVTLFTAAITSATFAVFESSNGNGRNSSGFNFEDGYDSDGGDYGGGDYGGDGSDGDDSNGGY
ncbi:hypothetical protein FGB62_26g29 [Gracilaria domingensis]|nr:hypothetical protein FGB62_26g29 [Gracilaria domingensis]